MKVQFVTGGFDSVEEAALSEGLVPIQEIEVYRDSEGWCAETKIDGKQYKGYGNNPQVAVVNLLNVCGVRVKVDASQARMF
jgi:hypothetical protein